MSREEAGAVLSSAGLKTRIREVPSDQSAGTVLRQSPGGGAKVGCGARVTLSVSSGPTASPETTPPRDGTSG